MKFSRLVMDVADIYLNFYADPREAMAVLANARTASDDENFKDHASQVIIAIRYLAYARAEAKRMAEMEEERIEGLNHRGLA
jgi:hypothetical protein